MTRTGQGGAYERPTPQASVREVSTSRGIARTHVWLAPVPRRRLVLGHGAGGGVEAPDLSALAQALPGGGTEVWLMEQPWRVAGKRVAPAPSVLDDAWCQVLADMPDDLPLLVGGRSAGARVACRTVRTTRGAGVVALAFPLHPPGRPDRSRADELAGTGVLTLVVQGANDSFGRPSQLPAATGLDVVSVPGDHSLRADTAAVVAAVQGFVSRWP